MKSSVLSLIGSSATMATLCALAAYPALAQQAIPHGYTTVIPLHAGPANASYQGTSVSVAPLPMWNYSITAGADLGGGVYTGTIMGRSPFYRGKTVTTIPTQVIPLVITITDTNGTFVYDPTAADACVPGHTATDIVANSPIFTNNTWSMNGVNIGDTQYIDAFQRAEFWSLVGGSNYHLTLAESTLASHSLSFGTGGANGIGANYTQYGCEALGVVQQGDMDAAIQALIAGPLSSLVNVGTFPIFLTKNVVMDTSGTSLNNCCILGYHSAFTVGSNIQVYSPFSVDTSGIFAGSGFVSTLSHEMGEAVNDPTGNNATPIWGNQGQQPGCQNNFEVGDPLSPGGIAPTSNQFTVSQNGLTYKLQEMAFFSWFYGGTSLGAGGKFSNNATFGGDAKLCSNGGGTN